jgi:LPS export ABC transporter protein LptC
MSIAPHFKTVCLLLSIIFFFSCENDINKVRNLNAKSVAVEEAIDVKINYTLGGKTKSILRAPVMLNVQDPSPYVEFPKTIHGDFYDEQEAMESKLDARYAQYKQYQSVIYMRDSVVVINMVKGDTLYCEELYWDRNRSGREFYTDKPVKIRTKTESINGIGMEAGQNFRNWHILESTGNISVPANKFPGQ